MDEDENFGGWINSDDNKKQIWKDYTYDLSKWEIKDFTKNKEYIDTWVGTSISDAWKKLHTRTIEVRDDAENLNPLHTVEMPIKNMPFDKIAAWFIENDIKYVHLSMLEKEDEFFYVLGLYSDEDLIVFNLKWR